MGCYDTFGEQNIQLKNGECLLSHYHIGDDVALQDGIYVGYEGFAVVYHGRLVATFAENAMVDKWGNHIRLDLDERNPITKIVKQTIKDIEDADGVPFGDK
jgi:hypothetical protein